jgi:hypothetical protein
MQRSPKKAQMSPTKSIGPSFDLESEMERRKHYKEAKAMEERSRSGLINSYRFKQRETIKNDIEISREEKIIKHDMYKQNRTHQWKKRMSKSPYHTDLVADTERIQEEMKVKRGSEMKKKAEDQKKISDLKTNLILTQILTDQRKKLPSSHMMKRIEADGMLF